MVILEYRIPFILSTRCVNLGSLCGWPILCSHVVRQKWLLLDQYIRCNRCNWRANEFSGKISSSLSFFFFFLSDYVPRYKFIMLHILEYRALECTHESQTCNIFLTSSRRVLARVDCSAAFAGGVHNLCDHCGQRTISARW